ncbi:Type IV pilus biogenesis [compost metagenome]|jgi:type IV pilus biogenesis protein PilP
MHVNSLFLLALALPMFGAVAADRALPTVGDLSAVQSDTIMFEAQAKRADAKAKMQESTAKAGDDPVLNQLATSASIVASDLPTVTGVSGVSGRLVASVCYSNGTTIKSKSGQTIPGGFVLTEITIDRVVAAKGDRRVPLQFVAVCNVTQSSAPAMPMLPGQMPPFMPPPVR